MQKVIAKQKGFVIFVPNTKEGDAVKVKVTKVFRKVGFAEVIGEGEAPAEDQNAEDSGAEPEYDSPSDDSGDTDSEEKDKNKLLSISLQYFEYFFSHRVKINYNCTHCHCCK